VFVQHSQTLLANLAAAAKSGEVLSMQDTVTLLTMDIICDVAMSKVGRHAAWCTCGSVACTWQARVQGE
jgi:hypothetical protein